MGYTNAVGMAQNAPLETGLHWHLTANHYPPVGFVFDSALEAIANASAGDWDKPISIDWGEHRLYGTEIPTRIIIESYHLEPWVETSFGDE